MKNRRKDSATKEQESSEKFPVPAIEAWEEDTRTEEIGVSFGFFHLTDYLMEEEVGDYDHTSPELNRELINTKLNQSLSVFFSKVLAKTKLF